MQTTFSYQLLDSNNEWCSFLNVQIMAPANMKDLSKQGPNDRGRWKMFLGQVAAALGIIQRVSTIFRILTFVTLTKRVFKALSGYATTV